MIRKLNDFGFQLKGVDCMALISEILNAALSDNGKALRVEILGGIGGNSMRFLSGVTNPTSDIGVPGDVYLNTTSGDLFKNDNGTWNLLMNLVGPQGPKGDTGPEGDPGAEGVGIENITSDGTNVIFHLSNGTTKEIPWPTQ